MNTWHFFSERSLRDIATASNTKIDDDEEKLILEKESSSSEKNIHAHKDVIKEETVCTQDKSDDPKIIETVKNELEAFNQVFNVLRGNSLLAEALEEETPVENKHGKLKQSETVPEVYVSNDDDDDVVYLIKKNEHRTE